MNRLDYEREFIAHVAAMNRLDYEREFIAHVAAMNRLTTNGNSLRVARGFYA